VLRTLLPLLLLIPLKTWATLGEVEDSIARDREALSGQQEKVQEQTKFRVHEMLAHSTRIRQFVDSSGQVFALSWRGIAEPDQGVVFGRYAVEVREALANRSVRRGRIPMRLETANLIYTRGGHPRDLTGTIYIKNQLPSGVLPKDIK